MDLPDFTVVMWPQERTNSQACSTGCLTRLVASGGELYFHADIFSQSLQVRSHVPNTILSTVESLLSLLAHLDKRGEMLNPSLLLKETRGYHRISAPTNRKTPKPRTPTTFFCSLIVMLHLHEDAPRPTIVVNEDLLPELVFAQLGQ